MDAFQAGREYYWIASPEAEWARRTLCSDAPTPSPTTVLWETKSFKIKTVQHPTE